MPCRTRLVLVHDVTEAHMPIEVCKANGASSPWMPKRTWIRTERREACPRCTHGEHEPKAKPRGERQDSIRPVCLFHHRCLDRCRMEEMDAIQRPARGQ